MFSETQLDIRKDLESWTVLDNILAYKRRVRGSIEFITCILQKIEFQPRLRNTHRRQTAVFFFSSLQIRTALSLPLCVQRCKVCTIFPSTFNCLPLLIYVYTACVAFVFFLLSLYGSHSRQQPFTMLSSSSSSFLSFLFVSLLNVRSIIGLASLSFSFSICSSSHNSS